MAIYLKKFENHIQYENYINGSDAILPNVSICTTEGGVYYNPYVEPIETRVVAKYNVTSTSSSTRIIGLSSISPFSEIEIDGVVQPTVVSAYTFSTAGEHIVKYTLTNPTTIGNNSFQSCSNLTSIVIPNSVTSIGASAFNGCAELTNIIIPSGVTAIEQTTFRACGFTSFDIPNNITNIGNYAFQYCSNLISVTVRATTPPTLGSSAFSGNASGRKIYVPSASVNDYKATTNWSDYASAIEPIQ